MPRWPDRLSEREPYERAGLCCGCGAETRLTRIRESVYRCAECAKREMRGERTQWIPGTPRRAEDAR